MANKPAAIILAAGHSERMGRCKFLLKTPAGKTFIEEIWTGFYKFGLQRVVVVTQSQYLKDLEELCADSKYKPLFIENRFPEKERFYSLRLGIRALGEADHAFVHNADNPGIQPAVLEALYQNRGRADYLVPTYQNKGGHPVLLGKKVLKEILFLPENLRIDEALKHFTRFSLACDDPNLSTNINTAEAYTDYMNNPNGFAVQNT
ncbi:MAG TPA: NTP transferase domain-containing protein [Bacteroidia bacterium]|nr:NTP transferase domain-containing protein [Bacteroidia bacterium]